MARTDYGAILSTVIKDTSDAIREVNGTSSLIAPNGWGSAIRTMHSDSDYENALEQMIEETAIGDIASFSDGANDIPLKSLACTINPVQSGTGDPSPSNIRPITGHDDVTITQKDGNNTVVDTTTITFPDTVYGASLDVGTGVLTVTYLKTTVGELNWGYTSGKFYSTNNIGILKTTGVTLISDTYKAVENIAGSGVAMDNNSICGISATTGLDRIYITDSRYTDETQFKTAMENVEIVYPLATPITTQLTPEQLNSILGENNFYHDGNGEIQVVYKANGELYVEQHS